MSNHLIDALRAPAEGRTADPMITRPDAAAMGFGAFWEGVDRISARLARRGLRPGDRVAAQVPKSVAALQLYLACVQAGGVFVPLNPAYTAAEVDYFLGDAEPALMVCMPERRADLRARHPGLPTETLDAAGAGSLTDPAPETGGETGAALSRGPEDLAAILYTSGTTGRSKGAMLSHGALLSNSRTLARLWRFSPADRLIHALPIFHTHGLFVASNVALLSGARMHVLPGFDTGAILAAMPGGSVLMGVPTFYTRLLAEPRLDRARAASMRLFISGSAPLAAETHRSWEARTDHRILERYGMTETNMNTSNPCDGERRAGTVGLPLPGVDLRIMAEAREAGPGEVGVIEVRGPNLFSGYWRMPEKTAEDLRPDGWFVTGDLATRDADGYVTIVGRARDLVISGGFNIYPKEVEEVLDALPGVLETAVIGVPHPDLGEAVVAVVVGAQDAEVTEAGILAAIADRLARFKQPRRVILAPELPRNTMGKVQKAALRQAHAGLFAEGPLPSPTTPPA